MVVYAFAASCSPTKKHENSRDDIVEINPLGESVSADYEQVTLYFKYINTDMLVGQTYSLSMLANEKAEYSVLQYMIAGPQTRKAEFIPLINSSTRIINITNNAETLNIIFSSEFLDFQLSDTLSASEKKLYKRLAVYSIVNTMIELSGFTKVQILVDKAGDGKGERIELSEAGFDKEGFLEPLNYNASVILSPENTLEAIFDAMTRKDLEELYYYIAYYDRDDSEKLDESVFVSRMYERLPSLENYLIKDCIVSNDGQTAHIVSNYNLRYSGEIREYTNIPIKLIKENDTWKIQFSRFESLFIGG